MGGAFWKTLQPLRIPGGWSIMFNNLEQLEPEELAPEDRRWLLFTEDIFYVYTDMERRRNGQLEKQRLGIDLGWYPEADPNGCFRLEAVLNGGWEAPLLAFSTRSTKEVVETMEKWFFREFPHRNFIEEDLFRRNYS